jgi:hypothetical protein
MHKKLTSPDSPRLLARVKDKRWLDKEQARFGYADRGTSAPNLLTRKRTPVFRLDGRVAG